MRCHAYILNASYVIWSDTTSYGLPSLTSCASLRSRLCRLCALFTATTLGRGHDESAVIWVDTRFGLQLGPPGSHRTGAYACHVAWFATLGPSPVATIGLEGCSTTENLSPFRKTANFLCREVFICKCAPKSNILGRHVRVFLPRIRLEIGSAPE
jgi:hypothetical protein